MYKPDLILGYSRDGTGSKPLTVTRPDPDAVDPVTRPGHWVSWIERLFWRRCDTSECFLPNVSGLCSTQTGHEHFQHNCKFIKY